MRRSLGINIRRLRKAGGFPHIKRRSRHDRVILNALMNILEPVLDARMNFDSYACRKERARTRRWIASRIMRGASATSGNAINKSSFPRSTTR